MTQRPQAADVINLAELTRGPAELTPDRVACVFPDSTMTYGDLDHSIRHCAARLRERGIEPGMRIAQMVIAPVMHCAVEEVDELDETVRGGGGFGSTGR